MKPKPQPQPPVDRDDSSTGLTYDAPRSMKHLCLGCDKLVPASKTLCASCAEDMGYARRAR